MSLIRLDKLLVQRGLSPSREQAQAQILAGEVWSAGVRLEKPGQQLDSQRAVEVRGRGPKFVSRGGEKLEAALDRFGVSARGRVCMDVGSSTGGFTDCLLKRGATRVFCVDSGYGQLDYGLRKDPRVSAHERTNARLLTGEKIAAWGPGAGAIDLGVMDVSFISVRKILAPLRSAAPTLREWVLLFKPQFEVGREAVGKGGVVRTPELAQEALDAFRQWMNSEGWVLHGEPEVSPIRGKKSGNVEFLLHYTG